LDLAPEAQLFQSALFERLSYNVDGRDNFLDKNLQHRMRSREAAAHVTRCRQQVLVFVLKSLLLIFPQHRVQLVRQDSIVGAQNEVYVVFELREEAFEPRR